MGMTLAIFNLSGNIPLESDWLIIAVMGCEIMSKQTFRSIPEILSMPELFLGLKAFIILRVVSSSIVVNLNCVVMFCCFWR
jgi:hypothetical protein